MTFEWIPFLIALLAALYRLWVAKKETDIVFIVINTILSTIIGIVLAFIGGIIFPSAALTLDTSLLLDYLWSSLVGAIIPPIVKYIAVMEIK